MNMHVAFYAQWGQGSMMEHLLDSNLLGIEACSASDSGRISVNPNDFLCSDTLMEVHLHPVDSSGAMAVSPNNSAFLLNLTLPIVNFSVVMLHDQEQGRAKLTVMNVTMINEESLGECAILSALNSEMLLQSIN